MADPDSRRDTRELACRLSAQICEGQTPNGLTLLSYIIMFENYLDNGASSTGELMGWDVVERPPVDLALVRSQLKEVLS